MYKYGEQTFSQHLQKNQTAVVFPLRNLPEKKNNIITKKSVKFTFPTRTGKVPQNLPTKKSKKLPFPFPPREAIIRNMNLKWIQQKVSGTSALLSQRTFLEDCQVE